MRHTCSTCGYCKSGALLSEVSNGREDPCETCEAITVNEFTNWHPIPITNADRIRAMCDEDLALFLETATEHGRVDKVEWVRWLKQEANI